MNLNLCYHFLFDKGAHLHNVSNGPGNTNLCKRLLADCLRSDLQFRLREPTAAGIVSGWFRQSVNKRPATNRVCVTSRNPAEPQGPSAADFGRFESTGPSASSITVDVQPIGRQWRHRRGPQLRRILPPVEAKASTRRPMTTRTFRRLEAGHVTAKYVTRRFTWNWKKIEKSGKILICEYANLTTWWPADGGYLVKFSVI